MNDKQVEKKWSMAQFLAENTAMRLVITATLVLLMLIPLALVGSIVDERHMAYEEVLADISGTWGREQVLTGPILIVPYTEHHEVTETKVDNLGTEYLVKRLIAKNFRAVILPEYLSLEGKMHPEYRYRGIYKSLVYGQEVTLNGSFAKVETQIRSLSEPDKLYGIHWDKAIVAVGMSDPKGIARVQALTFGGASVDLAPGTRAPELLSSGFHAPLSIGAITEAKFNLEMKIKGSDGFRLAPLGKLTEMNLSSIWAHPSFYGDLLPASHEIKKSGFKARWSIPHLVRSYPQNWILEGNAYRLDAFSAGVRLFEPVTLYTEATRAVKYGILFIALTFLTLVLMELVTRVRPNMMQYAMIGIALSLFYLLLIALSEHIGFNLAYVIAAGSVIAMNSLYSLAMLSKKKLALIVMIVLIALYAVLFMILRAEGHALLAGSLLLLAAVAATMFFTRNLHRSLSQ
jgi:inner membrane protein